MPNTFTSFFKKHPILSVVIGFQAIRLGLVPLMGLMPQDAYYFMYGQHLDWSYFDHPGMVGYMLRGFTEILGSHVWVLKAADFTVSSLSLWVFYNLCTQFLSQARSAVAMLLLCSSVLLSMLSLNSTPDVPLFLFWALSLYCLEKAIFKQKWTFWILGGLCMGLAFNSKYTAVLLPFGLMLFLLFSKTYRKLLWGPWPWVALGVFTIVCYPVYYWNEQHDFISFAFQSTERSKSVSDFGFSPKLLAGFIATQVALIFPLAFLMLSKLAVKYSWRVLRYWRFPSDQILFLGAFFLPTFLGFFLLSPFYWIKINWLVPSYVSGLILLAVFFKRKWLKPQLILGLIIHSLIAFELATYIVPIRSDDTWWGWEELSQEVSKIESSINPDFIFSADNYKTAAILRFYKHKNVYSANVIGDKGLQFGILHPDLNILAGQDALFIDSDPRFKNLDRPKVAPEKALPFFKEILPLDPILIRNSKGEVLRKFHVFKGVGYLPKD
ncbi:MAG: glycosyltransferase family 39 protein [Flavobacteriaceae bacterium]|nr:glycosyltransferase family 39 protein [Flavobacteriaceae bacterium]MCI5088975.1 glycosyltransferase family 39 protein [Flavobacteriaceae bacterium]